MRKFGILGYPLTHSFSKKYFDQKFLQENISDAEFVQYSIEEVNHIGEALLHDTTLEGFCITIPHKKNIISFLHEVSPNVADMGACNCVRIKNGILTGYNTDVLGFEKSFTPLLKPHHTHALVLGTGGAASAVLFVLNKLNITHTTVSRQPKAGQINYTDINQALLNTYSVIINCTPLGTYPNVNECPQLPYHLLNSSHYLYDLVYNPPLTKFLEEGQKQGATIKNGYDMLTIQAEENWRIWNS